MWSGKMSMRICPWGNLPLERVVKLLSKLDSVRCREARGSVVF